MERRTWRACAAWTASILLCACGQDHRERQPSGWPLTDAQRVLAGTSQLFPAAEIDGDRCVIRFGMREVEIVGMTAAGDPIAFCRGARIAVCAEVVRRGHLEEALDLARRADPDGIEPPRSGEVQSAHATAAFDPLLGLTVVFPTRMITASGTLTRTNETATEWQGAQMHIAHHSLEGGTPIEVVTEGRTTRVASPSPSLPQCQVVVTLTPGTDPLGPWQAEDILAAELLREGTRLARWSPGDGFTADVRVWRREFASPAPPHLLIVDPRGAKIGLCATHGLLRIPRKINSPVDENDFLTGCAAQLRDRGHLALLLDLLVTPLPRADDATACASMSDLLATMDGGMLRADDDAIATLVIEVLARQGRRGFALGRLGALTATWAEAHDDGVHVEVLARQIRETFVAQDVDSALTAALARLDGSARFAPRAVPFWRVDDRGFPVRAVVDARAFLDADRHRSETQVIADCGAGRIATAADFMSAEIERAMSDPDAGVLRRLGSLRLQTGEPRGALALFDRARTFEGSMATRLPLILDSIRAATALDDADTLAERFGQLRHALEESTAGFDANARLLARTGLALELAEARDADLAAALLLEDGDGDVERLIESAPANGTRATTLGAVVRTLATIAPHCVDAAHRDLAARLLTRVHASTESIDRPTRLNAGFATMRLALGDSRFAARAAGRADDGSASPFDDTEAWAEYDTEGTLWLPLLEDLADRRIAGQEDGDLPKVAARSARALDRGVPGDDPVRAEVALWSAIGTACGSDAVAAERALRACAQRSGIVAVESRLARVAAHLPADAARALVTTWTRSTGDKGCRLRCAWLALAAGSPSNAVALAEDAEADADPTSAAAVTHELACMREAVTRLARLRPASTPPR